MTKEELNALKATGDGTLGKYLFSFDPCIFQSALVHLPCIGRVDVIITDRLTITQHALRSVTSWELPCQTMPSPTCVVWHVPLFSAHHQWLKNTFLLLLKAASETVKTRKIISKLSDRVDGSIVFGFLQLCAKHGVVTYSVTELSKDQNSRAVK